MSKLEDLIASDEEIKELPKFKRKKKAKKPAIANMSQYSPGVKPFFGPYPRLNRTRIISIYLKTIGKQWEKISAYERSVLSSFAEELIKQVKSDV